MDEEKKNLFEVPILEFVYFDRTAILSAISGPMPGETEREPGRIKNNGSEILCEEDDF